MFCLSDCPSVFVCFSVVEPCTSVQLPTLLLLCISERRVRERERERERKKEELIGQQYSHFALCVPVLYVRARALTRFRKTASFVVVHKEKKMAADTVQDVKNEATMQAAAPNAVVPCDPTVIYFTKQCNCITPPPVRRLRREWSRLVSAHPSHLTLRARGRRPLPVAARCLRGRRRCFLSKKCPLAPRPRHCQRSLQSPGRALVRKNGS